jgi:hypothetical protein
VGWLTRIVIGIAIASLVGFDGVSIGVAHVSAVDDADTAALAASHAWHDSHDMAATLQAAQDVAAEHGETVLPASIEVAPDGGVDLTITRDATTVLVRHVHALHSWTTITQHGSGRYIG